MVQKRVFMLKIMSSVNFQRKILICLFFMLIVPALNAQTGVQSLQKERRTPLAYIDRITDHFWEKHNQFSTSEDIWGPYHLDLTFEALLTVDAVLDSPRYVSRIQEVMRKRNYAPSDTIPYQKQPFSNISFALFMAENDSNYIDPFVSETRRMINNARRSKEGAVCHIHDTPGCQLLIDYLQEYTSRAARAGWLSGDPALFVECCRQYVLYADILRDPETGLWSQGRGWLDDVCELSPGAWSRGHGWLIRGMVTSLDALPEHSKEFRFVQILLQELADALLRVQDENGMWHQLLNRPFDQSYPESSGTGLIAYYLVNACDQGYLKDIKYLNAAERAITQLYNYVSPKGAVMSTCPGPGPLRSESNYMHQSAPLDDPHGAPAMIYAFTGALLLQCLH